MDVPFTACRPALRWSACEKEKLACLVAMYADMPEDQIEDEAQVSMGEESLNQCTVASAVLVPKG